MSRDGILQAGHSFPLRGFFGDYGAVIEHRTHGADFREVTSEMCVAERMRLAVTRRGTLKNSTPNARPD